MSFYPPPIEPTRPSQNEKNAKNDDENFRISSLVEDAKMRVEFGKSMC